MRVIAGSARRLLLKTLDGLDTRPTTDRIKETLFNMLQPELADCMFLDLFSGSGAIGIEALSRGAGLAVMIENNPKALECIRENLSRTKLEDRAMVMGCDVITGLKRLEGKMCIRDRYGRWRAITLPRPLWTISCCFLPRKLFWAAESCTRNSCSL